MGARSLCVAIQAEQGGDEAGAMSAVQQPGQRKMVAAQHQTMQQAALPHTG